MVWFNVDDGFWSHPKVLELDAAAVALWVRAGSYCAKHLTDGKVSHRALRLLDGDENAAAGLVLAGLWVFDDAENCWWFHDWAKYQRTREQVEAERTAAAERMRTVRANRKANVRANNPANVRDVFGNGSPSQSSPIQSNPGDSSKTSQSQSRNTRASVSTDALNVPEMTRKLAAQKGITSLRAVADAIHRHTGLRVDANGAYQVATSLLDRAKVWPDAPGRYVSSAIEQSPAEVQQFIHEHALEVA